MVKIYPAAWGMSIVNYAKEEVKYPCPLRERVAAGRVRGSRGPHPALFVFFDSDTDPDGKLLAQAVRS
jgi:hypothetical protein